MKKVNLYSPLALEPWSSENPWTLGIGGSETCHIELTEHLIKRGHDVRSFSPLPLDKTRADFNWFDLSELPEPQAGENWLVFREPAFFDKDLPKDAQYIFIAQDVDYQWTPERLDKVDKYICLCPTHVSYTLARYPQLDGKIYLSTNGVRDEYIRNLISSNKYERDPNKIIYTSSPDRGLLHILKNWFRIRERCPKAELHVFYGFNNMESILAKSGGTAWFVPMKNEIQRLMDQDGIKFRGRVGQHQLYEEYLTSNVWYYPSDWPETSCINCMDAQSCGSVPVVNNFWAVGHNVFHGYMFDNIPQKNQFTSVMQIHKVCDLIEDPWTEEQREEMMDDALTSFSWSKVARQYEGWLI